MRVVYGTKIYRQKKYTSAIARR